MKTLKPIVRGAAILALMTDAQDAGSAAAAVKLTEYAAAVSEQQPESVFVAVAIAVRIPIAVRIAIPVAVGIAIPVPVPVPVAAERPVAGVGTADLAGRR